MTMLNKFDQLNINFENIRGLKAVLFLMLAEDNVTISGS